MVAHRSHFSKYREANKLYNIYSMVLIRVPVSINKFWHKDYVYAIPLWVALWVDILRNRELPVKEF